MNIEILDEGMGKKQLPGLLFVKQPVPFTFKKPEKVLHILTYQTFFVPNY